NPLFMVSVVEDLVTRGLIVLRDGRGALRAALAEGEVGVPDTLRQMTERPLGQLEEDEREVLAVGSVAGVEFSAASVAGALRRGPAGGGGGCGRAGGRALFLPPPC